MSVSKKVKVRNATKEIIIAGAKEYGIKVSNSHITIDNRNIRITKKGQLEHDWAGIRKLGNITLDSEGDIHGNGIGEEIIGRLAQAGTAYLGKKFFEKNAYTVVSDTLSGTLEARRSNEHIKVNIARNGHIDIDANNFKDSQCHVELGGFMNMLGKFTVISEENKVTPQQVIRTVGI